MRQIKMVSGKIRCNYLVMLPVIVMFPFTVILLDIFMVPCDDIGGAVDPAI